MCRTRPSARRTQSAWSWSAAGPPGEREHVIFYCPNCEALVEDIDFDCADIVQAFSQAMLDFWADDARRTCKSCGTRVEKAQPVKAVRRIAAARTRCTFVASCEGSRLRAHMCGLSHEISRHQR
jgi:hypothetical protein